jgi:hypothetical protein
MHDGENGATDGMVPIMADFRIETVLADAPVRIARQAAWKADAV